MFVFACCSALLVALICLTAVSQEAQLATLHGISLPKLGSH